MVSGFGFQLNVWVSKAKVGYVDTVTLFFFSLSRSAGHWRVHQRPYLWFLLSNISMKPKAVCFIWNQNRATPPVMWIIAFECKINRWAFVPVSCLSNHWRTWHKPWRLSHLTFFAVSFPFFKTLTLIILTQQLFFWFCLKCQLYICRFHFAFPLLCWLDFILCRVSVMFPDQKALFSWFSQTCYCTVSVKPALKTN